MFWSAPILLIASLTAPSQASPTLWNPAQIPFLEPGADGTALQDDPAKVNVTLYVMSRCSDSRICETVFEDVLREEAIQDKVNLELQMVTKGFNDSEPLGITCKHGPLECAGNAHYLCLHNHLSLKDFLGVLQCMNFQTPFPGHIGKTALTRKCVETNKIDWWESGIGQCIQGHKARKDDGRKAGDKEKLGKEGRSLLLQNAKVTQERGIERACRIEISSTINPGGKRVCVVDDHTWTGCDDGHSAQDFIRVIEEEYDHLQN